MFNKTFKDIAGTDIQNLIASGASEGNNLEFKREPWGNGDEEVREMLRDVSSMANAYGGYLLIGIDEEDSTGKAKQAVDVPDAENYRDRLLASCMANLQPRIIGLDIKTIECEGAKKVVLIKVPDSLNLHQVTFKGLYQFWRRHDRQKSRMTYEEIRDTVIKNNMGSSQNTHLLKQRKSILAATGKPLIMVTAQPVKTEIELFKIGNEKLRDILKNSGGRYAGWNLDFRYDTAKPTIHGLSISDNSRSVNLFRDGYMEASIEIVKGYVYDDKEVYIDGSAKEAKLFRSPALVEFTDSFLKKIQIVMSEIGYEAPMSYSVALLNISGFVLYDGKEGGFHHSHAIWRDGGNIEIEPITFEFLKPEYIAKELCDRLWQAFGFEGEPYYKDGKFVFAS